MEPEMWAGRNAAEISEFYPARPTPIPKYVNGTQPKPELLLFQRISNYF